MKKRKPKIIEDKKQRGEWAEMKFMARAAEHGLPVSKPWGDSNSFDCVVGRPGKFVAVQVKSTIAKLETGKGYICSTCSSHKAYRAGSFDFLAAYVAPEDAWYIVPAKEIRGLKSISLCTQSGEAKYEKYREAWDLLRKAAEVGEDGETNHEEIGPGEAGVTEAGAKQSDANEAAVNEIGVEEARAGNAGAKQEAAWRPPASALERVRGSMNYVRDYMQRGGVQMTKKEDDV